jgi:superkiller protein 3
MSTSRTEDTGSKPYHAFARLRDISISRAMLWMEAVTIAFVLFSLGMKGWEQSGLDTFNQIFVIILTAVFIAGLVLFRLNNLNMGRKVAMTVTMILAGCLLVSYSILLYESGDSDRAMFLLALLPGSVLAVLGIGMLVVRERLASRLPGYYALWLFGLLMVMFMPLHELGAINYSSRDVLVGFFGLAISFVGAAGFSFEKRMATKIDAWVTAGDAKYIAGKFDDAIEYYEQALFIEPKSPKVWANTGSAFLRLGMWEKALESFGKALEMDGGMAMAHSGRGLALAHLKRYEEALESHDMAIRADNSPVSWNNKGNTLVRMGAPVQDAIACYRKALELDAGYDIAWFNRGKAEVMNDDVRDAIDSLTRAVELNPQSSDAWFQRGRALSMQGDRDQEALFCFETAIELKPGNSEAWAERKVLLTSMKVRRARPIPLVNIPSSGVVFGPAARNQPLLETVGKPAEMRLTADSAKLRDNALRMAASGDYPSALAALEGRLAAVPNDIVTWMTKGVLLSRIGKFDDALAAFDAAIELKPDWVGPLFSRGMILAAKGEYDEAFRAMDAVTEKRPNYADAWSVKGIILGTQKRYVEAIDCFDRAIEINPASEDAWHSKSTALNKLGRYEEAIVCYEKLAALSPGIEDNRRALQEERTKLDDARILFRQGVDLAKSRLFEEGLLLLRDAIELRPNYIDALYISGVINGVLGRYKESLPFFERVLELKQDHVEALYGKANALLKQGSYSESLEMLETVLKLSPEHVDAWCDRGVALARMGKKVDAMECYDRALKIAGDHPQAVTQKERCVRVMREVLGDA